MQLAGFTSPRPTLPSAGARTVSILVVMIALVLAPQLVHSDAVMHGLGFSPYMDGQSPPDAVSAQQIRDRLDIVDSYTEWIRTWGMRSGLEQIPQIAHDEFGLSVAGCAFLNGNLYMDNNDEIQKDNLIAAAVAGYIDVAIVGNEALVSGMLDKDELISHLDDVRQRLDALNLSHIPVTTAEPFGNWANSQPGGLFHRVNGNLVNGAVLNHVDLLFVNLYPFHEGAHINSAIAELDNLFQSTRLAVNEIVPGLPIAIGETGWPSAGNPNGLAAPTLNNAERYFNEVLAWAGGNSYNVFYFEAFDENWKPPGYANVENHWGLHYADGTAKFVIPEPSTALLFGFGLLGMLGATRRARRG
jgi:GPH family glycoside/pentoside/hexuronide:cation symporter